MNHIIKAMAKANYESGNNRLDRLFRLGIIPFEDLPETSRAFLVEDMQASIRAAMECAPHSDWCSLNEGEHNCACDCWIDELGALLEDE